MSLRRPAAMLACASECWAGTCENLGKGEVPVVGQLAQWRSKNQRGAGAAKTFPVLDVRVRSPVPNPKKKGHCENPNQKESDDDGTRTHNLSLESF